ncbi:MAG: YafY family transcriptional regulator [Lachnospiraceae bacterium]|nr:YafY family transcriptional regulator [Lachnospiraceae bacterium]
MKIDRLIGILSVLLQKKAVTAPYLAKKFEVSRRTINRDIEELCKAGIPIVTKQGVGGGISIMEDYKLERTLLTGPEMQDILAGLRSLDSADGTNRYKRLMEKLSVGASDFMTGDQSVLIDLASWDKSGLAPKIEAVRTAIDAGRELVFRYYAPRGESDRCILPYYLIFHWSSWYVWGFCRLREDYRLFKLNRMEALFVSDRTFEKRAVPLPDLSNEHVFPEKLHVKALFDAECKWRLVEEFGFECFAEQEDGRLLFCRDYTDEEHLVMWLLGFGEKAELLEPEDVREKLRRTIQKMEERYRQ